MDILGSILMADDEDTFLMSTADLLRNAGYECDCVSDATSALRKLQDKSYDLLISDIKMPGNSELSFIKKVASLPGFFPVILVTGYPCINTAIDAVHLPVTSYLVKPFDFDELLERVNDAVKESQEYRKSLDLRNHKMKELENSLDELNDPQIQDFSHLKHSSMDVFFETNLLSIARSVVDINKGLAALSGEKSLVSDACYTMGCHKPQRLSNALKETIKVLEKTRHSFKSKELAELRRNLEKILESEAGT